MIPILSSQVQGVKDSMLVGSVCPCITEEELKKMLPVGTSLEEYWPREDFLNKDCKGNWWTGPSSPSQESASVSSGSVGTADARFRGT